MRILDRSVFVGPSLYAHFPVIRLELDLGKLEAWPTGRLGAGFVDALVEAVPGLAEHGCSYREPGGLIRRMKEGEGTWLGHVLEHVAIELQNMAGEDVTFGKTRSIDDRPGVYSVVYEYAQREEGIEAGELALKLLRSLLPAELRSADAVPEDWNWPEARDTFIRYAQRRALGPSTMSLVKAAEERNIPWLRLNEQSLVQLGHGKYQQRIQATVTGKTSHIPRTMVQLSPAPFPESAPPHYVEQERQTNPNGEQPLLPVVGHPRAFARYMGRCADDPKGNTKCRRESSPPGNHRKVLESPQCFAGAYQ